MASVPEDVLDLFRSTFRGDPDVISSAPGRVNLIGEHTDYNGGEVLPIAIEQRTLVAMRRSSGSRSRAVSSTEKDTGEFIVPHPRRSGHWWDYVSGLATFAKPALPAVDLAVVSDVPAGAGLSSSAALEVAAGLAYAVVSGATHSIRDIALDAWRVETQFVGVACGIMDQFASALSREGHALHVWCDTTETEHVPFASSVLIFDTAIPRSLRQSEFNRRRAECREALYLLRSANPSLENLAQATTDEITAAQLPPTLEKRALHVAEETERVRKAVEQLRGKGAIDGELLYQSHESLREKYECSSRELDWFVEHAARAEGVTGARLTGAGWGGCAIALGERDALAAAGDQIAREYKRTFSRVPWVCITQASYGAALEPV